MDSGQGYFDKVVPSFLKEQLEAAKSGNPNRLDKIFSQGEIVIIENKSSKFVIRNIDHISGIMTLKLLPEKKSI